eukprot:7000633-Lingulodinium_polyedra.AAC.1
MAVPWPWRCNSRPACGHRAAMPRPLPISRAARGHVDLFLSAFVVYVFITSIWGTTTRLPWCVAW